MKVWNFGVTNAFCINKEDTFQLKVVLIFELLSLDTYYIRRHTCLFFDQELTKIVQKFGVHPVNAVRSFWRIFKKYLKEHKTMKYWKKYINFSKFSQTRTNKKERVLRSRSPWAPFWKIERRSCCVCEKKSAALNAVQKSGVHSCSDFWLSSVDVKIRLLRSIYNFLLDIFHEWKLFLIKHSNRAKLLVILSNTKSPRNTELGSVK